MMQFDTIISIYVRHALTFFDAFMKMEGQKGKCKDDIKSYSLDRFEQVERSKSMTLCILKVLMWERISHFFFR